jgi:hypothetical protein
MDGSGDISRCALLDAVHELFPEHLIGVEALEV